MTTSTANSVQNTFNLLGDPTAEPMPCIGLSGMFFYLQFLHPCPPARHFFLAGAPRPTRQWTGSPIIRTIAAFTAAH
jgi:hypothetical protein